MVLLEPCVPHRSTIPPANQRTSRSVTRLALAPPFSQMPFSDWLKLFFFFVNYMHYQM